MDSGSAKCVAATQNGFDFDSALPGQAVPELPPVVDHKLVEWLRPRPAPHGEPSGETCARCNDAILVDDLFAEKFGEHVECFDRE